MLFSVISYIEANLLNPSAIHKKKTGFLCGHQNCNNWTCLNVTYHFSVVM